MTQVSTTTITAGKSIIHIIDDVIVSTKLLSLLSGPSATPSPSPSPEPADPTYDDLPSVRVKRASYHASTVPHTHVPG